MIEVVGTNVGDISTSRQNHSHKQQLTSISLTTYILDTSDPESYVDAHGKPKWEQAMQHEMHSLEENHTWDLVPQLTENNVVKC